MQILQNITVYESLILLKKHCPTATPAGKVTAGVNVSLTSPEPIEFEQTP